MENTATTNNIEDTYKKAYFYAIRLLTKQNYSVFKMREKLKSQKFDELSINKVIEVITDKGFLQEDEYIRSRVKTFMNKGFSPEAILYKLNEEHLNTSLDTVNNVFHEYQTCPTTQIRAILDKRIRTKTNNEIVDFNFRKKLLRYVISKGHDLDLANREIEKIIRSNSNEENL